MGRLTVAPPQGIVSSGPDGNEKGGCPVGGGSRLSSPFTGAYW